jgi:predicted DNA-binding transcriptional regulator AlpA
MSDFALRGSLERFDTLPDAAMIDVRTVAGVLGRSTASVWRDSRSGRIPRPVRVGPACTRWNVGAIRRHLAALVGSAE